MSDNKSSTDGPPEEHSRVEAGSETFSDKKMSVSLTRNGDGTMEGDGLSLASIENQDSDSENSNETIIPPSIEDSDENMVYYHLIEKDPVLEGEEEEGEEDVEESAEEQPRYSAMSLTMINIYKMKIKPWRTGCPQRHLPCPTLAGKSLLLFESSSWIQVLTLYMRPVG